MSSIHPLRLTLPGRRRHLSVASARTSNDAPDRVRVCFVTLQFHPIVGGAEAQAAKQAHHLLARGHQVIVLTLRHQRQWPRTEVLAGLPIVRVGGIHRRNGRLRIGRLGIWAASAALSYQLWRHRHRFDVIHVFQVSPLAGAAVLMGKLLRKPTIVRVQSAGPSEMQRQRLEHDATLMSDLLTDTSFLGVDRADWATSGDLSSLSHVVVGGQVLLRFLRRSQAYYQVVSTRCASRLVTQGFRPERVVRIPSGVDIDRFRPAEERRPSPSRPERDIICIARLAFPKGVDVLLHAWSRMMRAPHGRHATLRPRLLIVGDGADRPQLERIARELGVQESVEFLGLRHDTVELLQRAWGFVLPSRWEGMPNALLEAMACALPCIATRVSGSEDVITDGVNGLLVEPEDPIGLAEALRLLIEDVGLAQQLAREAQSTVLRSYRMDTAIQRCLMLYRHIREPERLGMRPVPGSGEMRVAGSPDAEGRY